MEQSEFEFGNSWATRHGLVDLRPPSPVKELAALSDRLAIIDTITAYSWSADERRMDIFAELFAEEAVFEIVVAGCGRAEAPTGRDAIVAWMSDFMDGLDFQMRHRLSNVLVTEQSEHAASALSYLLLTSTTRELTQPLATGCYAWELVREQAKWRIARASVAFDKAFA